MRVIVANCSAEYSGRGETRLAPHVRMVVIKDDGSLMLHSAEGVKPLNYMRAPVTITQSETQIVAESRTERLVIDLIELIDEYSFDVPAGDPGLERDGTEDQLQEWLADNPGMFGDGYHLVSREYRTPRGPVDILFEHSDGHLLFVEVKRTALASAVDQVLRYVNAYLENEDPDADARACVAALDIRAGTLTQAAKKGVSCLTVPCDWAQ